MSQDTNGSPWPPSDQTPMAGANGAPPPRLVTHLGERRPLKGQATSGDSRAERMLRHFRSELDELSRAVEVISTGQEEMVLVSPQAVAENPSIAATLSPAVLVNSLIAAGETEHELESRIASLSAELTAVRAQLEQVERERAGERGRLSTLDEVIAALHGNLEDLREERRYWSRLPAPAEGSQPRLESGEKLADILPPIEDGP